MAGERGEGRGRIPRGSPRDETLEQRADRNLSELLQELRVALPGVQVLFAFLLTVPFSSGFSRLDSFQRNLYFAVLCCAALATVLLIAPSAAHRILFRRQEKEFLVVIANRLMMVGLGVLAIAMSGVMLLISDLLFSRVAAVVVSVITGIAFAGFWYVAPLVRRYHLESADLEDVKEDD